MGAGFEESILIWIWMIGNIVQAVWIKFGMRDEVAVQQVKDSYEGGYERILAIFSIR